MTRPYRHKSALLIPDRVTEKGGLRQARIRLFVLKHVLDLSKGTETNKAISDIGLIVTDLVKTFLETQQGGAEYYDESEYIEPEFSTNDEQLKE